MHPSVHSAGNFCIRIFQQRSLEVGHFPCDEYAGASGICYCWQNPHVHPRAAPWLALFCTPQCCCQQHPALCPVAACHNLHSKQPLCSVCDQRIRAAKCILQSDKYEVRGLTMCHQPPSPHLQTPRALQQSAGVPRHTLITWPHLPCRKRSNMLVGFMVNKRVRSTSTRTLESGIPPVW